MNIQSIVNMGFMMRNVSASVRKEANEKPNSANAFEQRLFEFRKSNTLHKLREPAKQEAVDKKESDDWEKVFCSSQLFSVWDSNISAEEALKRLDGNLSQIGEYSFDSGLGPREVLEHIAAQYAIHKKQIAETGNKEQLQALDKMIEQYTTKYAGELADAVGGFYESNGMVGECDRIYTSAIESVNKLTDLYEDYMGKNKKLYGLLEQDANDLGQSLSNELRKAVRESGVAAEGFKMGNHNSVKLENISNLAKISHAIGENIAGVQAHNEEELGVLLGKNVVMALSHLYDVDQLTEHEAVFLESVKKQVVQHLDKLDAQLNSLAGNVGEQLSAGKQTPYEPLNRDAIFSVIDAMAEEYKSSHSISSALEKGKMYGLRQYLDKADTSSKLERYKQSSYWETVVKNALNPTNIFSKQYRWVQELLESKTNAWLNAIA